MSSCRFAQVAVALISVAVLWVYFLGWTPASAQTVEPAAVAGSKASANTVEGSYLGLSAGPLRAAVLVDLPENLLLRTDGLSFDRTELQAEIDRGVDVGHTGERRSDHPFHVLENMASQALLVHEARGWAAQDGGNALDGPLVEAYLQSIADAVWVDEGELRAFYDANPAMFNGAAYPQVAEQLRSYLLEERRQRAVENHLNTLSERHRVELDAQFVAEAAETELANPVDQARRAGLPALVDFGAEGCVPCDMMTPILAELRTELVGKCTVLFVHVRENPILAARYGVRSIPVQVFFDGDGHEVSRHVGFFPKDRVMSRLGELGVQ